MMRILRWFFSVSQKYFKQKTSLKNIIILVYYLFIYLFFAVLSVFI